MENAKQSVKTAIAGLIALYITRLFHLPDGYWAAISALIVMQSNVGATLSAARTRLAGTAVGALIAWAFVSLWGSNTLAFATAVAIAFYVCTLLGLAESQRLATVTVAIIMLVARTSPAWVIALHRFAEVALGIVVAVLVSLILWPSHARRSVRQGLTQALVSVRSFYLAVMQNYLGRPADAIESLRAQAAEAFRLNASLLQNALQEAFGFKERESLVLQSNQAERIFQAVETLEFAVRGAASDSYFQKFAPGIEQMETGISQALESLAQSFATKKPDAIPHDLLPGISTLDEQAAHARQAGETLQYPLDEVLRFYFLLLTSRNLARELELAIARTGA